MFEIEIYNLAWEPYRIISNAMVLPSRSNIDNLEGSNCGTKNVWMNLFKYLNYQTWLQIFNGMHIDWKFKHKLIAY